MHWWLIFGDHDVNQTFSNLAALFPLVQLALAFQNQMISKIILYSDDDEDENENGDDDDNGHDGDHDDDF